MTTPVRIETYTVGQAFGCGARVVTIRGRRTVYRTARTYPYGMRQVAYQDALAWVGDHGYAVHVLHARSGIGLIRLALQPHLPPHPLERARPQHRPPDAVRLRVPC